MVYEATFKETTLDGSTIYEGIGYTFDDVMEYCVECQLSHSSKRFQSFHEVFDLIFDLQGAANTLLLRVAWWGLQSPSSKK